MISRLFERIRNLDSVPPWSLWGAAGAVIASFAATLIGFTAATVLVEERHPALNLFAWAVAAALVIVFVRFARGKPEQWAALRLGETGVEPSGQNTFWYLLVGIGLAVSLDVVGRAVTQQIVPEPELYRLAFYSQYYGQAPGIGGWLVALLFMGLLQPLADGLVFQGIALPSLRAVLGAWPGFLLSAVIYAAFHYAVYPPVSTDFPGLWYGLIAPLLAGLIFGAIRLYTGSTRAAIITHAAFGLFAVVKLLTLVS
ncbi:MAG: CPBP family intramembrane glutamic endopeptidase [Anaerolineae bacterium]